MDCSSNFSFHDLENTVVYFLYLYHMVIIIDLYFTHGM